MVAVFGLLTTAAAQRYVTSPPGFENRQGTREAYMHSFGAYTDGRQMYLDGDFRSRSLTLTEIAFRPVAPYSPSGDNGGRTWTAVSLEIAETDLDLGASATFSANLLTTPTQVFSASVTFPTLTSRPPWPAPWAIQLPFTRSYNHSGIRDLALDFRFWNGTPTIGNWSRHYSVDGVNAQPETRGISFRWGNGYTACVDSGATAQADLGVQAVSYGPWHPDLTLRGNVKVRTTSSYTAPRALVVHVLSENSVDLPFYGQPCGRLFLDLGKPLAIEYLTADVFGLARHDWPLAPAIYGFLYGQAAWCDSRTGAIRATHATACDLEERPDPTRREIVESTGHGPTGGLVLRDLLDDAPLWRYRY